MKPLHRLVTVGTDAPGGLLELSPVLAEALAVSVGQGESPPVVLLRRQRPYVLLGPDDRRLPRLERGLAYWRRAGLPVYERVSGGSAVVLDEGCLSFAVARPCRDLTLIRRNYEEMAAGVVAGLRELGVRAEFGRAAGSFCEGPYDLVAGGRKVAGVAQALRGGFALVSGMVLVSQDAREVTARLEAFYEAAGQPRRLDAGAVTSLEELLGRPVSLEEVEAALRKSFGELYRLEPAPPGQAELERARELARRRRVA